MKLELKHIAPYLPYGLSIYYELKNKILLLTGLGFQSEGESYVFNNWCADVSDFDLKPILRPLSDLTKEIEHNGKKFVPLVELYKMSNEYNYNNDLDYEFIDSWGAKGNILKVYTSREKEEYTEFVFSNMNFRKDTRVNEGSYSFGMNLPYAIRYNNKIHNQHKLFELLYEWHFDIYGLIENGLAIDINTLEK